MPPKKTGTPATTRSRPENSPSSTPAKKKKTPIAWDKDGAGGMSSIRILLDWLAIDGNYQRWRGDTKAGSTKAALANEILAEMADAGITHRDNKGIQTKVQELQASYAKASDFLRNTGSGLMDDDIENGTTTLQIALTKICKYWDELDPIMASRTVSNPPATTYKAPNLLDRSATHDSDNDELPPPLDFSAAASVGADRLTTSEGVELTPEPDEAPQGKKSKKKHSGQKKMSSKDPLGLEKIMDAANEFQQKALQAREKRQARQEKKEARRASADRKQAKRANARQKKALRYESRKIRLLEMEARIKMKRAEWDEVRERFAFVRELKALGHTTEEIEKVIGEQFNQPEGSNQPIAVSSDESDVSSSSSGQSSEEENKS